MFDNRLVLVIQTSFWHVRGMTFSKVGQKDMLHTSMVHSNLSEGYWNVSSTASFDPFGNFSYAMSNPF